MPEYNINYTLNTFNNRNAVRMAVVQKLSEEVPGEGKGDLASNIHIMSNHYLMVAEFILDDQLIFIMDLTL